jgi:hypothetical protein
MTSQSCDQTVLCHAAAACSGTCAFHCQLAFPAHYRPEGHCRDNQMSVDGGGLRGNADCSAGKWPCVRSLALRTGLSPCTAPRLFKQIAQPNRKRNVWLEGGGDAEWALSGSKTLFRVWCGRWTASLYPSKHTARNVTRDGHATSLQTACTEYVVKAANDASQSCSQSSVMLQHSLQNKCAPSKTLSSTLSSRESPSW